METNDLITQTLKQAGVSVLEKSRFGRSEKALFWVNADQIAKAAMAVKSQAGLDWLENLSAMHLEDSLVFTYFVRSTGRTDSAIFRASVELVLGSGEKVKLDSVTEAWPMATSYEAEISRLFGVKFPGQEPAVDPWEGFPLRKNFGVSSGGRRERGTS